MSGKRPRWMLRQMGISNGIGYIYRIYDVYNCERLVSALERPVGSSSSLALVEGGISVVRCLALWPIINTCWPSISGNHPREICEAEIK